MAFLSSSQTAEMTKPGIHEISSVNTVKNLTFKWTLTEAHSAETLQNGEHHHPGDVTLALDAEDTDHEEQYQRRLATHHHKLGDDVREQNLKRRHTWKNAKKSSVF
jgi:hypothetical protein